MNDLTKAYLKALLYFYGVMIPAVVAPWALYAAGADLRGALAPLTGDPTGAYADCLVFFLAAVPGTFLMMGRMKANAQVIKAANEGPLCAKSFQALALGVVLTGVLGFGLLMALAFAFLPYVPTSFDPFWVAADSGAIMGWADRVAMLVSMLPIFLASGAAFGAFMWGTGQKNLAVRIVTWAVFAACILFNPFTLFTEQAPPTLMEKATEEIKMSPVMEEELKRMDEENRSMEEGE